MRVILPASDPVAATSAKVKAAWKIQAQHRNVTASANGNLAMGWILLFDLGQGVARASSLILLQEQNFRLHLTLSVTLSEKQRQRYIIACGHTGVHHYAFSEHVHFITIYSPICDKKKGTMSSIHSANPGGATVRFDAVNLAPLSHCCVQSLQRPHAERCDCI